MEPKCGYCDLFNIKYHCNNCKLLHANKSGEKRAPKNIDCSLEECIEYISTHEDFSDRFIVGDYKTIELYKKKLRPDLTDKKIVHPIIIADNGRIICRAYIEQVCRKISKQLGKNITFHCLRHSNTTTLYENGVPVKAIQQRLGHKSPETTMKTYAHNTQKMTDIAVSTIDDCLIHSLNSCGQNVDTLLN